MKVFHLPKRLPPGFIFLVIFLIALPGFMLGKNQVSLAKMLPSLLSEKVFPVSRAEILTEGQRVSVKFQITSKDEGKVKEFSQNLGVDNRWTQGLSVSLDGDTGKFLVNFLPAQVNLTIKPKEIDFASNENVGFFDPSLMTEIYHGSFGDGTISVQDINGQGYQIDIDNPAPVVSGLVAGGQLKLSDRLADWGLWQLLPKFAKIKLKVSDHNLKGSIILK